MKRQLTQQQVENVQIDYGMIYINFGEVGEYRLGPTRGGGTFTATKTIRDIEFDGAKGKTKGMQVVDDINAMLTVNNLDTSMENLSLAMPWANYSNGVLTAKSANVGVIQNSAYLKNVTMFAKVVGGGYKKITLYNAMNEKDFVLAAVKKGEGEVGMEISAHWDALDDTADLFKVEDVSTLTADTTPPTVTTVPLNNATAVVVSSNLTATFSEDIRESDINNNNFILINTVNGTIAAGVLTYTPATKTALFDPTSNLAGATKYIWTITNVRDLAGNKIATVTRSFTTA